MWGWSTAVYPRPGQGARTPSAAERKREESQVHLPELGFAYDSIFWLPNGNLSNCKWSQSFIAGRPPMSVTEQREGEHRAKIPAQLLQAAAGSWTLGCCPHLFALKILRLSSCSPDNSYCKQMYLSSVNLCYNFERLEQFMNLHLYLDTETTVAEVDLKRPHKPRSLAVSREFQRYCVIYGQLIELYDLVSTTWALQQIQALFEWWKSISTTWVLEELVSNLNIFPLRCGIWDF